MNLRSILGEVPRLLAAGLADAPLAALAATPAFNGADTAWMLISTVLVLLMTVPWTLLFYSGMLRAKNGLSIIAHTIAATAAVTVCWAMVGYSIAFTSGGTP